jgi:amino-acid N-acetyltransferase
MNAPSFTLRTAKAADLPAIVSLLEDCGLPLAGMGAARLWVADPGEGQHAIGVVGLEIHGEDGLLRSLAVRDYRRGAGIGAALVEQVMAAARTLNLRAVHVLTEDAAEFFQRLGFSEIDRSATPEGLKASAQLQGACPDSARLLVRPTG